MSKIKFHRESNDIVACPGCKIFVMKTPLSTVTFMVQLNV